MATKKLSEPEKGEYDDPCEEDQKVLEEEQEEQERDGEEGRKGEAHRTHQNNETPPEMYHE